MEEDWKTIEEFPNYQVSTRGRIMNRDTGRIMKPSITTSGIIKIGLVNDGEQQTRSVKVLVAEAFVDGRSELFDTAIHLDGNYQNVDADNLVWRPRWFAWKYARQFSELEPGSDRGPLRDVDSGRLYLDLVDASTRHGLLIHDVWKSIYLKQPTFPTWQTFEFT